MSSVAFRAHAPRDGVEHWPPVVAGLLDQMLEVLGDELEREVARYIGVLVSLDV